MRAFTTTALLFLLLAGAWIFLFVSQLGGKTIGTQFVYHAYAKKEQQLTESTEKKLLVVGGSNVLFGLDSSLLTTHWNLPVYNYGSYAGLSASYMLDRAIRQAENGDTLLLALEYNHFRQGHEPLSSTHLDFIASRDPKYFWTLGTLEKLEFIAKLSPRRLLEGMSDTQLVHRDPIYSLDRINARGDLNADYLELSASRQQLRDAMQPFSLSSERVDESFADSLRTLIATARAKGLCVLATRPAIYADEAYQQEPYQSFFDNIATLYEQLDIPYLYNSNGHMLEKQAMLDTIYHVNNAHRIRRTEDLIKAFSASVIARCGQ